jgi:hypothetical protein
VPRVESPRLPELDEVVEEDDGDAGDELVLDEDVEAGGTSDGLEWSCWTPRGARGSRRDLRRREVVQQVTLWSAAAVLDGEAGADGVDADGVAGANGVDADGVAGANGVDADEVDADGVAGPNAGEPGGTTKTGAGAGD